MNTLYLKVLIFVSYTKISCEILTKRAAVTVLKSIAKPNVDDHVLVEKITSVLSQFYTAPSLKNPDTSWLASQSGRSL